MYSHRVGSKRTIHLALIFLSQSLSIFSVQATENLKTSTEVIELNFEDLPHLLQEKNLTIRGVGLSVQAAEYRTGYLTRSYLPTLALDTGGEHFQTGSYPIRTEPYAFLETRINLYRGGKDSLEDSIRQDQVGITRAQAQRTSTEELTDARKTYWTLIYQREMAHVLKDALQENEKNLASAKQRIQRGVTSDTDRVDFEINQDLFQEELSSIEHEIELTQIKLRSFFSWPENKWIETPHLISHTHDETLLEAQIPAGAHPDVAQTKATSEMVLHQSSQANRWWTPTVDVYGGYYLYTLRDRDYLDVGRRDDLVAGIRFSIPLFDGLQSRANAISSALQSEAWEAQAQQKEKTIQAKLKIAQEEVKHHHELTHIAETRIQKGAKYLSQTLSEYRRGVKNFSDLQGALQRQISFKRRYAEIKRDYQLFRADLLALLNK
jgi:outer membrane protein TolC